MIAPTSHVGAGMDNGDLAILAWCDLGAIMRTRAIPLGQLDAKRRHGVGWAAAEVGGESDLPAFGAGGFCPLIFPALAEAVAEEVARPKAAGPGWSGPPQARSRAILRADLLVAGHPLVFALSAVEL